MNYCAEYCIFSIPPLDHWCGWTKLSRLAEWPQLLADWNYTVEQVDYEINTLLFAALKSPSAYRWEGDIREGPFVTTAGVFEDDPYLTYGWKQDNNGNTFVATPFAAEARIIDSQSVQPELIAKVMVCQTI